MHVLLTLICLSSVVFGAEVATLSPHKSSREFQLMLTDEALFAAGEKQFMTHACRFKTSLMTNSNLRENNLPEACRAEITKFLLNAGYKPLDAETFYK